MADRDTTPTTVNLDRRRPYRVNDSDRTAVWVGPGEASVPRWVAEAWGIAPAPAPAEPTHSLRAAIRAASDEELIAIPGIGEKSVAEVRAWAESEEAAPTPTDEPEATTAGEQGNDTDVAPNAAPDAVTPPESDVEDTKPASTRKRAK